MSLNGSSANGGSGASTPGKVTRTVAIIKNHALDHRFDIERRIQEASFEIVKERQMEFDVETDPEFMYELFGDDVDSLAEGPVWVYVLERRRAVEVWNSLMGHRDPDVAKKESPNSLRALYGISIDQNGLMGSTNVKIAETQIASIFASSPPFPTSDLPAESRYSTMRSVNQSVLSDLQKLTMNSTGTSNVTSGGSTSGKVTSNGKPGFKARTVPASNVVPDIAPRGTKAAALRLAGPVVKNGVYTKTVPREGLPKDRLKDTFGNVPGHKRSETIAVASTAAPTIAPRMTKAAALRLGIQPATSPVKKPATPATEKKDTFDGVPGHRRRETIAVASVQAPTVAPRTNRSAALRANKDVAAPPSSFMFKTQPRPGLTRSNSQASLTPPRSKPTSRPASAASSRPATVSRATSSSILQSIGNGTANGDGEEGAEAPKQPHRKYGTDSGITSKPAARPSSIGAPTIAPRTNKSAALRAAKKAEEEAAAAAAAARKYGRPPARPSSVQIF